MNRNNIVFAVANPEPEVDPKEAVKVCRIFATGRSDFPNQVNNVLGFPYIFRGALDVRARAINFAMKLAAAEWLIAGLINDLAARTSPVTLVFDDYHVIESAAVQRAVSFLLTHAQQLHLIIITRADPPLPLARLRAQIGTGRAQHLNVVLQARKEAAATRGTTG